MTSETLNGGAPTSYTYDYTDQLTNDGTKAYSYDANGNRTMSGYTTGADNQLTNDGVYTYTYDNEGNLTKKSKGASAETWTFGYDNRNQLTGVTERSTDGGGTLLFQGTYVYDVFNNRVEADEYVNGSGTTVTKSVYIDQGTLFADLTSGNAMQTRYLHQDNTQYSPVVARIDGNGAAGLLLDRLGSTRNIINGSGTLIGTLAYEGFGNITSESSPTNTGKVTFTGLAFLRNAGVLGATRRIYDPLTGRWDQQDPSRWQAGDANLYRDVFNNPTNLIDPSGLRTQAEWIIDPKTGTITMVVKVKLIFDDLNGPWTPERIKAFKKEYKRLIEQAFNERRFFAHAKTGWALLPWYCRLAPEGPQFCIGSARTGSLPSGRLRVS
ncbi:MAG: hypothetical protein HYS12_21795, partial [Planctomycetes bacterium]|nr:hypothetical protein [Planctomycetota bacterium]